jgi:hypothetical protein
MGNAASVSPCSTRRCSLARQHSLDADDASFFRAERAESLDYDDELMAILAAKRDVRIESNIHRIEPKGPFRAEGK